MFERDLEDFCGKIAERAKVKLRERKQQEEEQYVELTEEERIKQSPGGLDPLKVLEELPTEMKDAFVKQDIPALQKVLEKMDPKQAQYLMDRSMLYSFYV